MKKRPIRRWIARGFLAIAGWEAGGARPEHERCVLIAAPHTTNWDFVYLIAFASLFEMKISWMGKHNLFSPPIGWFMRLLGGIPVIRHRRENLVTAMARTFEDSEELVLAVPPEGTRGRVEYWKSGFYHIALTAKVPIVMSYLDYTRQVGGFGPGFMPTGDVSRDMDRVRAFYDGVEGKYPEKFSPIRLREEEMDEETPDELAS